MAARNASTTQIHAIRDAHAVMVKESKKHYNPLDADRLFHLRIAETSGNSALVLVVQTLWDQRMGPLYRSLECKLEYPKMAAETIREHRAIVAAIVRRDGRGARAAMREHMNQTHARYIKEWNAEN